MIDLQAKLEETRLRLIDQGLRNPLINMRVYQTRGLEIVDERSSDIYQLIVQSSKSMDFLSDPKLDQLENSPLILEEVSLKPQWFNPFYERIWIFVFFKYRYREANESDYLGQPDIDHAQDQKRFTDQHLQTPYSNKELQKRLLQTSDSARVFIEEQGINILYLTLGEMIWYEDDSSVIPHRAPLILIPVELSRASVNSRFNVKYTGDGFGGNVAFREKLLSDFRIQLPMPVDENTDEQDLDIDGYFEKVSSTIKDMKRWTINPNAIYLNFFSFGKFLMYHDLDDNVWPQEHKLTTHQILKGLLSDGFSQSLRSELSASDPQQIDNYLSLDNNYHVMDADSSQAQAILSVKEGETLIIQGPPGTGKSQTIANIISELIGSGRTVLFVAEKLAALEVVKRRLDTVGIGDLCLELHSHKATKKNFLQEIQHTLELGSPEGNDYDDQIRTLNTVRNELNAYSESVNLPIGKSGITPFYAYGSLMHIVDRLSEIPLPTWTDESISEWSKEDYERRLEIVMELQNKIARDGLPAKNPFWGSQITTLMPSTLDQIKRNSKQLSEQVANLLVASTQLSQLLGAENKVTISYISDLLKLGLSVDNLPPNDSVNIWSPEWVTETTKIEKLINAGINFEKQGDFLSQVVNQRILNDNLKEVVEAIEKHGNSLFRNIVPSYRKAIKILEDNFIKEIPNTQEEKINILNKLINIQGLLEQLKQHKDLGEQLFGKLWQEEKTSFGQLANYAQAIRLLNKAIQNGKIAKKILELGTENPEIEKIRLLNQAIKRELSSLESDLKECFELLQLNLDIRFGTNDLSQIDLSILQEMLDHWNINPNLIQSIASINKSKNQFIEANLDDFFNCTINWPHANEHLVAYFKRNWFEQLILKAVHERKALEMFDNITHGQRLNKFREMDQMLITRNRQTIVKKHYANLARVSNSIGQVRILRAEFDKKRRHKPIRKLISETYNAIQIIKPVFMMSPMSVATFLEPGTISFDVVIFDEASQIRPADAFGSIARGRQLVIVGDSKQLPPTNFFDSIGNEDTDDDSRVSDYESILGLCSSRGIKNHMLRWHYRSQHDSLIAVSNVEFYESRLVIAPSPLQKNSELGLKFRHLPDTFYEPGSRRYNRLEALAVAEAVIEHAREFPDLTLGVAAFSQSQMQAIRDELEVLRRKNIDCEPFFAGHINEPFFVKNLENVQGDERDVILISIGYGKTEDGKLSMNFGPLNNEGGERRLNVLITRARYKCEVFTNLVADDIDLHRTQSRGVAALKRFLQYAETGNLEQVTQTLREPGSPFEEAVASKLIARGYEVHYQVGTSGFFIDLAVVDPKQPGRYIIGIECDGAQYHRSASARDRDRLRQSILESKGWTIHRIWSTDWFTNPNQEFERVVEAIKDAQTKQVNPILKVEKPSSSSINEPIIARRTDSNEIKVEDKSLQSIPYRLAEDFFGSFSSIEEVPTSLLKEAISRTVDIEGPIHIDELVRRVARSFGFNRAGSKIKDTIEKQITNILTLNRDNQFISSESSKIVVRDRSNLPPESRKLEYVYNAEIAIAVMQLVNESQGIELEELIRETCQKFGFARVTIQMQDRVQTIILDLISRNELANKNGFIMSNQN